MEISTNESGKQALKCKFIEEIEEFLFFRSLVKGKIIVKLLTGEEFKREKSTVELIGGPNDSTSGVEE